MITCITGASMSAMPLNCDIPRSTYVNAYDLICHYHISSIQRHTTIIQTYHSFHSLSDRDKFKGKISVLGLQCAQ